MDLACNLYRVVRSARPPLSRMGCAALLLGLGACGGGGDGAPPAEDATQQPQAPAMRLAATARAIDTGASGAPIGLRVARSANGDSFVVWHAREDTGHTLWSSRYRTATATWGAPIRIAASSTAIDDLDLAVDAGGGAVVAWHEVAAEAAGLEAGVVKGARFDAAAAAWSMPLSLNADASQPRVAANDTGTMLALYVVRSGVVRGRSLDPASGAWQAEAAIEPGGAANVVSGTPVAAVGADGQAVAAFPHERSGETGIVSYAYAPDTGAWRPLGPDGFGLASWIWGTTTRGSVRNLRLTGVADGKLLMVWQSSTSGLSTLDIRGSIFTTRTKTWTSGRSLIRGNPNADLRLQDSDGGTDGRGLLLWTQKVLGPAGRTVLKAGRVSEDGTTCGSVQMIDSAIGGSAAHADFAVDPGGHAIAIWQQFESRVPDDGSLSNIAVSRFDAATGVWSEAMLAETLPGQAVGPRAAASGGEALLAWIQSEGGTNRVKALLQPLADAPGP